MEKIVCAAIHFPHIESASTIIVDDLKGTLVVGRRHHNCFAFITLMCGGMGRVNMDDHVQGFLTSERRFVTREEAATIAYKAKQVKDKNIVLYSEDLY